MKPFLYALDFDGVICDSALETTMSGWQAARHFAPSLPEKLPDEVLAGFRQVRPILETGYEAILICHGLYQGIAPTHFLTQFDSTLTEQRYQLHTDNTALKAAFARYRDRWMTEDFVDWINMNPLYAGISALLQTLPTEQTYIITTKQQRFVTAILDANQLSVPEAQIFGLEKQLKKTEILINLMSEHSHNVFFVEDRLPTLEAVMQTPELDAIQLGFATWGYSTDTDKHSAAQHARIRSLTTPQDIVIS